jgi:hypothetical protein
MLRTWTRCTETLSNLIYRNGPEREFYASHVALVLSSLDRDAAAQSKEAIINTR